MGAGYEIAYTESRFEHIVIGEEENAQGNGKDEEKLELWLQEHFLLDHEKVRVHGWKKPNSGDTAKIIAAVTKYVKSSKYWTDDDNPSL